MKIPGIALLIAGALITFLSRPILRCVFKKDPAQGMGDVLVKLAGLIVVVAGMLMVMEII